MTRRRAVAVSVAVLALATLLVILARDETARFLILDDPPGPSDAIVVMGAAQFDGRPSKSVAPR